MEWFARLYPTVEASAVMIHPARKLGQGASAVTGMRVMDEKGLEKLRKNLKKFTDELTVDNVASNTVEIAKRLGQFELNGEAILNAFSTSVKKQ